MCKKLFLLLLACSMAAFVKAHNHDSTANVITPHVSPSLKFTENMGQWNSHILFRSQLDGGSLFIENNCLTFNFYDKVKYRALHHGGIAKGEYKDIEIKCHAYKINFEGCNSTTQVLKEQQGKDYENFYLGNDKNTWKSNVKNYHQVWLKNLYANIDYEIFTATNGVKYNFHVKPGANTNQIKLRYDGVQSIKLKNGALLIGLQINGVTEQKPYAYQIINGKTVKVSCNYKLRDNTVSFDFPDGYNKDYELVIDPVLVFAAQSGSTADNFGMTATFDTQGNLYSGGTAFSNGYPTTIGAYSNSFTGIGNNGLTDVVITKYNATGTNLLYSTYIGGSQTEVVSSLIVDYNNNLCFYGTTGSSNFPMVNGAFDNSFNGGVPLGFVFNGTSFPNGTDIFIGKFNSSGTSLMASTFLGGSDNDGVNHINHTTLISVGPNTFAYEYLTDSLQYNYGDQYRGEIQVDILNNIYITSSTRSSNFPTANAYDNTLGGKQDAVICKLNPSLSQLLYSTYLGGSQNECGNSLIVNSAFEVYATGGTCSNNFPVTSGAYNTSYNGGIADGFVAHFNPAGNQILQATYIGTGSYDQSYFVQQDKYDRVYVYGQSLGNMPVMSTQPPATPYNNPGRHQFITRFSKTLSNITLSTVFGSSLTRVDISPSAFAVDKCNNIYLSGWGGNILNNTTPMSGMPLFQPTQATTTGYDFYFMGLDSSAVQLKYGSYFGGGTSREHVDGGTSRFDPRGKIYQSVCAGCGGNQDFPVTVNAWPNTPGNPNHSSNCNNGVVKLDFQLQMSISTINTNTLSGCSPLVVTFTNATPPLNPGATFKWYFGTLLTNTTSSTPTYTFVNPGTYTVSLVVNDNLTCNIKDSSVTYVTVLPSPSANIVVNYVPCTNSINLSGSGSGNLGSNPYLWNFGDNTATSNLSSVSHTYANNGVYLITFELTDQAGCKSIKTTTVNIFDFKPTVAGSPTICYGSNAVLNAGGGTSYSWSPAISLNSNTVASPVATPTISTIYTISINNNSSGNNCARSLTTQVFVNPTPTTMINYTVNPCGGGVGFLDKSKDDITNWDWKLTPVKSSTLQNPYFFYPNGGNYTVTLETTNSYGCKHKKDTIVIVPEPEKVSATGTLIICRGDKAQLNASGGIAYQWSPPATLDFPAIASPIANPSVSTHYSVAITTTRSVFGKECEYILTASVDVTVLSYTPVKAKANPELIVTGNSSTLSYLGDAGATVTWLPLNSTIPAYGYNVSAKPVNPTTYTAIVNKGPCTETVLVHVDAYTEGCLSNDVFIPNTFTPNGDGHNDLLFIRSLKVTELYFTVYNRWGEMVFETKDKTVGWDGKYKGRDMDVGVYGWYLKAKCVNGEETFLKGNVTLIR